MLRRVIPNHDTDVADRKIASRVTTFVFLTVFLDLIGFGVIIPLMPLYVESMGGSASTVGVILSLFALTQLIATPILGRLSDRIGRRPVILISLAGNALSMVAFAAATKLHWLPLLFVSRIMAGATAGNLSACQAAIADVTQGAERAKGMGRVGAGIGLGMVLGPLLGSTVSRFGVWAPPLAAAGMAFVDLVAAFFLMPETRFLAVANENANAPVTASALESKVEKPTLLKAVSERPLAMVLGLYFLTFLCITNLQAALALLTKLRLGWGTTEVGNVFGLFGLVGLVLQGALISPLTKRFGEMNLVVVGALSTGLGLAGIAASEHAIPLIASLVAMAIGFGITNPVLSAVAAESSPPNMRGAVLGLAQSAGGLARTVGPLWAGLLFEKVSPGAPFVSGAIAASVAVIVALNLRTERRAALISRAPQTKLGES
jgi:MFS transporter, DHA1 family, tetracycline resistance protein